MKKILGKILCRLGWHTWSCKIVDYIDEFGYVPLDNRVPMNARCTKCNKIYGDGIS